LFNGRFADFQGSEDSDFGCGQRAAL